MLSKKLLMSASLCTVLLLLLFGSSTPVQGSNLDDDLRALLWIASDEGPDFFKLPHRYQLHKIPQDPQNPLTPAKVRLGMLLYHETALGAANMLPEGKETYACASCHFAQAGFMANLPQGIAEGGKDWGKAGESRTFAYNYLPADPPPDIQPIRTPTVLNCAYQELMLWNGQFGGVGENLDFQDQWKGLVKLANKLGLEGVETQAWGGLFAHRMVEKEDSENLPGDCRVPRIRTYKRLFRAAFPGPNDPINRLNIAKAIAAYERTVLAYKAPWQEYLRGNKMAMTDTQKRGAVLFFGEAGCVACHTGPALNSMTFHALGMNDLDGSCLMQKVNLDTVPQNVREGRGGFTGEPSDLYKFKTPQLYNLKDSPFYGHGASFCTVRKVVEYMNAAVPENLDVPPEQLADEFTFLDLSENEIDDLVAFLEDALYDPYLMRYVPDRLPSGNCAPVNDPLAQEDLKELGYCRQTGGGGGRLFRDPFESEDEDL